MPVPPPSRWRTGTLAAAGTIPVTAVTAPATLVRSKGHHPAKHRPAIPTRVYESGSGGSRHAAPVRHPHPPRPPPPPAAHPARPSLTADYRLSAARVKGACGVAARALRAPMTRPTARTARQLSGHGRRPARPQHPAANQASYQTITTPAETRLRSCKILTQPLHMSRELCPPRPDHPVADLSRKRIQRRPVLGGLINEYERAA